MAVRVRFFLGEQDGLVRDVPRTPPAVIRVPSIYQQRQIEAGVRDSHDVDCYLSYARFR